MGPRPGDASVALLLEKLQIHVGGIQHRRDVPQRLRTDEAVGHAPCGAGQAARKAHHCRCRAPWAVVGDLSAQSEMAGLPVLAERAPQAAGSEDDRLRARLAYQDRLFPKCLYPTARSPLQGPLPEKRTVFSRKTRITMHWKIEPRGHLAFRPVHPTLL